MLTTSDTTGLLELECEYLFWTDWIIYVTQDKNHPMENHIIYNICRS